MPAASTQMGVDEMIAKAIARLQEAPKEEKEASATPKSSDEEYEYDGDTTDDTDDDRVDDSRTARAVYDEKAELAAAVVGCEREVELEAAAAIDPPEQVQRSSAMPAASTVMGRQEALKKKKQAHAKAMTRQEALEKEKEASPEQVQRVRDAGCVDGEGRGRDECQGHGPPSGGPAEGEGGQRYAQVQQSIQHCSGPL